MSPIPPGSVCVCMCVCVFYRCSGEAGHHEQRDGVWPECISVCVCVCVCVCVFYRCWGGGGHHTQGCGVVCVCVRVLSTRVHEEGHVENRGVVWRVCIKEGVCI